MPAPAKQRPGFPGKTDDEGKGTTMSSIVPAGRDRARPRYLAMLGLGQRQVADAAALLRRLPEVKYRPPADEDQLLERASVGRSLLLMLKVDQETEYLLCRKLAEHALGSVPEPPAELEW